MRMFSNVGIDLNMLEGRMRSGSIVLNGKPVLFRFLRDQDQPRWIEFVKSCSPGSLWLRFLQPFSPTPERAERFCRFDPEREWAVVAEIEEPRRTFIAVCRLIRCFARDEAEYAVIVADPWQKMTLGRILTELCIDLAKTLDFKIVNADTVWENFPMTKILNRCHFKLKMKEENMINLFLNLGNHPR